MPGFGGVLKEPDLDPGLDPGPDPGLGSPLARFLFRRGLGLPPAGLPRARWFFWIFTCGFCLINVGAVLAHPGLGVLVKTGGLAGLAVLLAFRVAEFRRRRLLSAWSELPHALALGVAVFASGPLEAGLGLVFTTCYFRAIYGSTRRTVAGLIATIAVFGGAAALSAPAWAAMFLSMTFGLVASTLLTRMLVATLMRQHRQVERNARLLTAVFDNLDVSVIVGGRDGSPAMMNRAARALHEELGLPEPPARWDSAVAVYAGDGRTPLPPDQMPVALALGGQRLRDVDMVLGLGDGTCRYFSVNAAPVADPDASTVAVVTLHDVSAARRASDDLAQLATHDQLTGLANRILLTRAIEEALAALRRGGADAAVILLDLDGFKGINDSLGHAFGDEVLKAVAGRLRCSLRPQDVICRLGGDEFAVLVAQGEGAVELAQRICATLRPPVNLTRSQVSISASIGLVRLHADQTAASVLAAADLAMYTAKAVGPGRVQEFHPDMQRALDQRLRLEDDLRRALDQDEFEMHYQPLVNLETGAVTGAEALVRWRHQTRGLVAPLTFVPILEDNGMIIPLGRWILRAACTAAAAWQPADPAQVCTMAVNVSARQLEDPAIVEDVRVALCDSGLPAQALTLEITESALVDDSPVLLQRLLMLKALGVKIAVDDFGTGYSSLSRLHTFPVDTLKIDISFVHNVENETGRALVRAILALANALDLDVVAEGVESRGQARALSDLGCRVAQGYYFAKPAPASSTGPVATRVAVASSPE